MFERFLLCCILALPAASFADANDGQFMGYRLGDSYPTEPEQSEVMTSGNLLIVADDPVKPSGIDEVRLVATAGSRTIGYIAASSWHDTEQQARATGRRYVEALRTLYPDWDFGRESMDSTFRIVEVNFDKAPYNLQLRLVPEEREGRDGWQFSMGLGWQTESGAWRAWQRQAAGERAAVRSGDAESLKDDPEFRGL